MKFIKKHTNLVVSIMIIVLLVAGLLILKEFLSPAENKAIYGSRLAGQKKVKISKDTIGSAESSLGDEATSTKVRIAGRIIEVNILISADKSLEDAKNMAPKVMENFSDAEKKGAGRLLE